MLFLCRGSYEVIVRVKSHGQSQSLAQVPVTVRVKDVNDNAPRFTREPYYALVHVNAERGDTVAKVC